MSKRNKQLNYTYNQRFKSGWCLTLMQSRIFVPILGCLTISPSSWTGFKFQNETEMRGIVEDSVRVWTCSRRSKNKGRKYFIAYYIKTKLNWISAEESQISIS